MDTSRLSIRSLSRTGTVTQRESTEQDPLLGSSSRTTISEPVKKSWYRARPLWIVPFAITAALCRSMTLAPRTEVFTQLACEELRPSRHHHTTSRHHHVLSFYSIPANSSLSPASGFLDIEAVPFVLDAARVARTPTEESSLLGENSNWADLPMVGDPPIECLTDPAVQAGAAKLQTIMTTTMGVLSTLTTGWWGQFGDRHGRTKVMACAVAGLLFTDIMFLIASNPPEALRGHAHKLLLVAPVVEGLLGGWSTMHAATFAYISACTSHGSRAHIFSRFAGVSFIGIAFGPEIAALILRSTHNTTLVFYTSAMCASVNLFLLLFVFPESLSNDVRARNLAAACEARSKAIQDGRGKRSLLRSAKIAIVSIVKPLEILGPRRRAQGRGRDWSMTMLSTVLFCHFLTLGLFQIKYLYAEHAFSWDAEKLSYYITAVGSARALHLLLILPFAIRLFKPNTSAPTAKGKLPKAKAKPTPATLSADIKFDILVGKIAVGLDFVSHVSVTLAQASSQSLFVGLTALSALGAGLVPALQSVAMSTMLLHGENGEQDSDKGGAEVGKLFGAIAVLQAVGSTILGPMLFGTVYSLTVARYPKAIFVLAAGLMVVAYALLLLIRRPRVDVPIRIRVDTRVEVEVERARGRSRKSKDIRQSSHLR